MAPASPRREILVSLLGLGVVGSGIASVLQSKKSLFASLVGCPLVLRRALVRDPGKPRLIPNSFITTNPEDILGDRATDIVVEVMGEEHPALEYVQQAISAEKHVVTANKEIMAKHGPDLLKLASQKEVQLLFEASVGAGIPIIAPLQRDLLGNNIASIRAIINGTTNYILTKMANEGQDFATALRQAQELGYAEANPANDVEGHDAAYKLAILATLAFRTKVYPSDIHCEGITRLAPKDFRYAQEFGYAIKLLAIGRKSNGAVQVTVYPALVPRDEIIAKVDGVFNAIEIKGDLSGPVLFHGMGAGSLPTTSAVLGDVISIARNIAAGARPAPWLGMDHGLNIKPVTQLQTRCYLRLLVADRPGVLAQIAHILGDRQISIASVIQKDADPKEGTAEIVIMTHPSLEAAIQDALVRLNELAVVKKVASFLRVEST
ncbi:MAG: homoserine dehydrogenase [Chloroflexi bacterium]|nr:homoserine dehydrogenase [Chloroflexota bacterium]